MPKIRVTTPLFPEEVTERCKLAIVVDGTDLANRIADRLVWQMGAGDHRFANDTMRYVARIFGIVEELQDIERAVRRIIRKIQVPDSVKVCRPRERCERHPTGQVRDKWRGTPPPGDDAEEPRTGWSIDWRSYPIEDIADYGPLTYNKLEILRQAGLRTIGELDRFRNEREEGGLLRISGIGERVAGFINDALNKWLKIHRDYAEFDPRNARLPEADIFRVDDEHDLEIINAMLSQEELMEERGEYADENL